MPLICAIARLLAACREPLQPHFEASPARKEQTVLNAQFQFFRVFPGIVLLAQILAASSAWADDNPNGPWRYSTEAPPQDWAKMEFDDAAWNEGPGGFGEPSTPGSRVNTEWLTPDIWLRRNVTL